jgi:hypothetical protein
MLIFSIHIDSFYTGDGDAVLIGNSKIRIFRLL